MTTLLNESILLNPTAPHDLNAQRIVLTGYMGAGKSTVGRLLTRELGWDFVDVDHVIEQRAGRAIPEIFAEEGEDAFRKLESVAIARSLGRSRVVIALGGGALESLTNRLLLEQTPATAVIFLQAPFEVLFDRCVLQEGAAVRPVLMNARAAAERFHQRATAYRRTAHHCISTQDQQPEETSADVLSRLRSGC